MQRTECACRAMRRRLGLVIPEDYHNPCPYRHINV